MKTVQEKQLAFPATAVLFYLCCNCPNNWFVSVAHFCNEQVLYAYPYSMVIFRISKKCKVSVEFSLALEAFNSVSLSSMS